MSLPTEKNDRKERPIARGVLDYFPDALAEVARVSFIGNQQHNPGEPLHWAREKSTDHADCVARHLIERGTIDTDGLRHTAKIAWRALAMLQEELESTTIERFPQNDPYTRPYIEPQCLKSEAPADLFTLADLAFNYDGKWVNRGGFLITGDHSDTLFVEVRGYQARWIHTSGIIGSWSKSGFTGIAKFIRDGEWVPYVEPEPTNRKLRDNRPVPPTIEGSDTPVGYFYTPYQIDAWSTLIVLGCDPDVANYITRGMSCGVKPGYASRYVYLAGPMRGHEKFNFPAFDSARDKLLLKGWNVVSPADIDRAAGIGDVDDPKPFVYRDLFAMLLVASNRGSIAMLPGWEKSTGATSEFFLARWLGLKIRDARTMELMRAGQAYANLLNSVDDYLDGQVEGK